MKSFAPTFRPVYQRLLILLAVFAVCSVQAQDLIYGIGGTDSGSGPNTSALTLFSFLSSTPNDITSYGTLTPTGGYSLLSITFQPTTGILYGLEYNGSQGQLVTIDRTNASLGPVGNPFSLGSIANQTTKTSSASISFNRQTGMLQLVTGAATSVTVNPATGATTAGPALSYVNGDVNAGKNFQISAIAFTNNALYSIDYVNNYAASQNVSTGALSSLSSGLGILASQGANSEGFTYPARGTLAYLSASTSTSGVVRDRFYTVNLTTGNTTNLGAISPDATFNTVSIAAFIPVPEPQTNVLCAAGLILVGTAALRCRRQNAL